MSAAHGRIDPERPTAAEAQENANAGDEAFADDLTEERQPTPSQRAETSDTIAMDP